VYLPPSLLTLPLQVSPQHHDIRVTTHPFIDINIVKNRYFRIIGQLWRHFLWVKD